MRPSPSPTNRIIDARRELQNRIRPPARTQTRARSVHHGSEAPHGAHPGGPPAVRDASATFATSATAAAVAELRRASKDDPEVRAPLADAGVVPFLASQLTSPSMSACAEDAAAALLNIAALPSTKRSDF